MRILNSPTLAILLLAGFLFLARYSLDQETSYTPEQINSVKQLLERKSGAHKHNTESSNGRTSDFDSDNRGSSPRSVTSFEKHQAKALMEIYNISEADIARPVLLWVEK